MNGTVRYLKHPGTSVSDVKPAKLTPAEALAAARKLKATEDE
jgi:hypothetical protein